MGHLQAIGAPVHVSVGIQKPLSPLGSRNVRQTCSILRARSLVEVFAVIGKLRGMSRKRVRYTFDVHFCSQEEKAAFVCRLKRVRELLSPEDGPSLEWFSSNAAQITTRFYEYSTCYTQECGVQNQKALMRRMPPDSYL